MVAEVGEHKRTNGNDPDASLFGVQQSGLHELAPDALSLTRRRNFGMKEDEIVFAEFVFEESQAFCELQFEAVLLLVMGDGGGGHRDIDALVLYSNTRPALS